MTSWISPRHRFSIHMTHFSNPHHILFQSTSHILTSQPWTHPHTLASPPSLPHTLPGLLPPGDRWVTIAVQSADFPAQVSYTQLVTGAGDGLPLQHIPSFSLFLSIWTIYQRYSQLPCCLLLYFFIFHIYILRIAISNLPLYFWYDINVQGGYILIIHIQFSLRSLRSLYLLSEFYVNLRSLKTFNYISFFQVSYKNFWIF